MFSCLDHEEPDRVPFDFWASESARAAIEAGTGFKRSAFLDAHDGDFRYVEGPRYVGPSRTPDTDIWGVRRRTIGIVAEHGEDVYSEVVEPPLAGARSVDEVTDCAGWPEPDRFDCSVVAGLCRQQQDQLGLKRHAVSIAYGAILDLADEGDIAGIPASKLILY